VNVNAIPVELRELPRWVVWRWGQIDPKTGKRKKPPYPAAAAADNDFSRHASNKNPRDWTTFERALAVVEVGRADGIGFELCPPFVGVDLDEGMSDDVQREVMSMLDSYSERSPSGTGHHVIVRASLNGRGRHPVGIGVFQVDRFFYVTGEHVPGTPTVIEERQFELDHVLATYMPSAHRAPTKSGEPITPTMPDFVPVHLLARLNEASEDRSAQTFTFVNECRAAGFDDAATTALALRHRPTVEKYGRRAGEEIARVLRKPQPAAECIPPPIETPLAESNSPETEGSLTLPFAPISSVLNEDTEEVAWTWLGYIAANAITLLGGWPKVGKTTLLCALLTALQTGANFLGLTTTKTGVLLLTEERKRTLLPKLRLWKLEDIHCLRLDQVPVVTTWAEVVRQAVVYCRLHGLALLVVDTFPKWAKIEDENAPGQVLAATRPLGEAAAAGLAVLALAHQRKARGQFGEAMRGSNALVGDVDVVIEVERIAALRDPHARVLRAISRFDETPESLVVVLAEDGSSYEVRGDTETAQTRADRDLVAKAIVAAGTATAEELAEATGLPTATVRRHANALVDEETVGRSGAGKKGNPFVFRSEFVSATLELLGGGMHFDGEGEP
jgi:AAA domain